MTDALRQFLMAWVRKDDGAALHPKFFRAGVAAYGWHDAGLGYCNRYLTDGFIPVKDQLLIFPGTPPDQVTDIVEALVREGLLETRDSGWQMHDFLQYQFSRRETLKRRKTNRRSARQGGVNSGKTRQAKREATRFDIIEATASVATKRRTNPRPDPTRPDPTRPDPTRPEGKDSPAAAPPEIVVDLFDRFYALYPRKIGQDGARKTWNTKTKTTSAEAILAGLERHLPKLLAEYARDPKFVPHPSTWLGRGSWKDEADPPASGLRTDPTGLVLFAQKGVKA